MRCLVLMLLFSVCLHETQQGWRVDRICIVQEQIGPENLFGRQWMCTRIRTQPVQEECGVAMTTEMRTKMGEGCWCDMFWD